MLSGVGVLVTSIYHHIESDMPFNHGSAHLAIKENTQVLTLEVCTRGVGICVAEGGQCWVQGGTGADKMGGNCVGTGALFPHECPAVGNSLTWSLLLLTVLAHCWWRWCKRLLFFSVSDVLRGTPHVGR